MFNFKYCDCAYSLATQVEINEKNIASLNLSFSLAFSFFPHYRAKLLHQFSYLPKIDSIISCM